MECSFSRWNVPSHGETSGKQSQVKNDSLDFSLKFQNSQSEVSVSWSNLFFFFCPELLVGNSFLSGDRAGFCKNFLKY